MQTYKVIGKNLISDMTFAASIVAGNATEAISKMAALLMGTDPSVEQEILGALGATGTWTAAREDGTAAHVADIPAYNPDIAHPEYVMARRVAAVNEQIINLGASPRVIYQVKDVAIHNPFRTEMLDLDETCDPYETYGPTCLENFDAIGLAMATAQLAAEHDRFAR